MNIICVDKAKAKRARDIDKLIVNARQMPIALPARLFKAWLENGRRYPRLIARQTSIQGKYILFVASVTREAHKQVAGRQSAPHFDYPVW